jgi:hypothetical protein
MSAPVAMGVSHPTKRKKATCNRVPLAAPVSTSVEDRMEEFTMISSVVDSLLESVATESQQELKRILESCLVSLVGFKRHRRHSHP